jgi:surface antigen
MILVGVSLALGGGIAAGQTTTFMKDAPISFMNREDTAMLVRNYQQALDSLPDGHTNAWTNPKTGHSGTATPLRTMKRGHDADCSRSPTGRQPVGRSGGPSARPRKAGRPPGGDRQRLTAAQRRQRRS